MSTHMIRGSTFVARLRRSATTTRLARCIGGYGGRISQTSFGDMIRSSTAITRYWAIAVSGTSVKWSVNASSKTSTSTTAAVTGNVALYP